MYDYVIVGAGSAGCVLAARLSRGPGRQRPAARGGAAGHQGEHPRPARLPAARSAPTSTGTTSRRPSRTATAGASRCRAARCSAAPPRSTRWSTSAATTATTTNGASPAGPGTTSSPTSSRPRTTSAAPPSGTRVGGPLPVSEQRSGNAHLPRLGRGRRRSRAGPQRGLQRRRAGRRRHVPGDPARRDARQRRRRLPAPGDASAPNLTVMPFMHVNRVLFEGTRAVGVEATQLGEAQELRAEREVILCGGAYNSPQLLMLSGVGPAEHLAMREVEVLLDQPAVGENLSDHACAYGVWTTPEPESLLLALEPAALEEFEASQTGPVRLQLRRGGRLRPGRRRRRGARRPVPRRRRCRSSTRACGDPEAHGVWVSPCLLTPESRGSVRARLQRPDRAADRSATTSTAPRRDMERMIAGAAADAGDLRPAGAAAATAPSRSRCPTATPTRRCARTSPAPRSRSTTRSAPARSARWSTPSCGSRASRGCASSTPR